MLKPEPLRNVSVPGERVFSFPLLPAKEKRIKVKIYTTYLGPDNFFRFHSPLPVGIG
jgi:hypothetical protein